MYEHSGLVEERLYVGGYEVYRKRRLGDGSLELERQTLAVMDGERRVALVDTKTVDVDAPPAAPVPRYRYQLDNHLGSSAVELGEGAQVITYEEYYPYGGTSFHGTASGEVSAKRYRYTGKERDEETGLYYFGARYYAAWLGRWTAADPAGMVDGPNLYWMTRDNPVRYGDRTGRQAGVDEPGLMVEVLPEAFAEPAGEEGSARAEVTDFEEEPLQLQPLSQEQLEEMLTRREGSPSQSEAEEEGVMAKAVWNWLAKMAVGLVALPALFFMGSPEGAAQVGAQLQNMEEALRVPYESELGEQLGGGMEQGLEYGTLAAGGVRGLSGAARHVARRVAAGVAKETAKEVGGSAIRRVGDLLESIDDVLANPRLLSNLNPADVQLRLAGRIQTGGWRVEALRRGAHKGHGFVLRQYTPRGDPTGRQIRWHPGGGHHGPDPYWRVIDANTKSDLIPAAPWPR